MVIIWTREKEKQWEKEKYARKPGKEVDRWKPKVSLQAFFQCLNASVDWFMQNENSVE